MIIKNSTFLYALVVFSLVLSACGGTTPSGTNTGGGKPLASEYIGIIDSITGDQWVINGITITVDPSVVRDGPFGTGDQVKIEGSFDAAGSFTVSRVESADTVDLTSLPQLGNDNSSDDNGNDNNSNDDNGNGDNSNDDDGNGNSDDDNGNDDNSNDDNGNEDNSNDDDGNDNSGDDNGNDDSGGSGGNDNDDDDDDDDKGNDDGDDD